MNEFKKMNSLHQNEVNNHHLANLFFYPLIMSQYVSICHNNAEYD